MGRAALNARTTEAASCNDAATKLVRRMGLLFLLAGILLVALEYLEIAKLLSDPVQGGLSFVVSLLVAAMIVIDCHRLRASARLRWAFYVLVSSGAMYMLISWTEDLKSLNDIPVLGRNDLTFRKLTKTSLLASWFTAPPLMALQMLRIHREMTDKLDDEVAHRTLQLTAANEGLQTEIRHHMTTGNVLKDTQVKLRDLVEQRSKQLAAAERELVRHERFRALGQMASSIAHELNNTLVPITSYVELLRQSDNLTDEQRGWLHNIARASADTGHIVHSLQLFHGKGSGHSSRELVDPAEVIRQVIDLTLPIWKDAARGKGNRIQIGTQINPTPLIRANAAELRQVLTNLILNSVDAIQGTGSIRISVDSRDSFVELQIEDDGCGMTASELDSCLDPFFTTKPNGVGLGLSVCRGIVDHHSGKLTVASTPESGTTFTLQFPVDRRDKHSTRETADGSAMFVRGGQRLNVLYVEDNPRVRSSFATLLRVNGLDVVAVENGEQAIDVAEDNGNFDILIVDMGLPGMNGAESIAALAKRGISVPTVVISGWSVQTIMDHFVDQPPPDYVLTKPVNLKELKQLLDEIRTHLSGGLIDQQPQPVSRSL